MLKGSSVKKDLIVGINYSGMHDSSLAVINSSGEIEYATSLERISRVKQDGRPPSKLIEMVDWSRVLKVATTTDQHNHLRNDYSSKFHPSPTGLQSDLEPVFRGKHSEAFYEFFDSLPSPVQYICHQRSHASAAAWPSGFMKSIVLCYDGGMANCDHFGGVYEFDKDFGLKEVDLFSTFHYKKITTLYTFITGLLGFTPMKHEGKITGLAAYGEVVPDCVSILERLFDEKYQEISECLEWKNSYSKTIPPNLIFNKGKAIIFEQELQAYTKEQISSAVQQITENHMLKIIEEIVNNYGKNINLCLSGGLFANVKLNSIISEQINGETFVTPFMSDDGTAVGAALEVCYQNGITPQKIETTYLGDSYTDIEIAATLEREKVRFLVIDDEAKVLSKLLYEGKIVARFAGKGEFGPRALGNRSILASPISKSINEVLNEKLLRSEFMPFAPSLTEENVNEIFHDFMNSESDKYMTKIHKCNHRIINKGYSIVHKDNTARPQIVHEADNKSYFELLREMSSTYKIDAIVNTSFNVHEEPIVNSPSDALRGFFISGLDYLSMNGKFLISLESNLDVASHFLWANIREKRKQLSPLMQQNNLLIEEITRIISTNKQLVREIETLSNKNKAVNLLKLLIPSVIKKNLKKFFQ